MTRLSNTICLICLLLCTQTLFAEKPRGTDYAQYLFKNGYYAESRSEFLFQLYNTDKEDSKLALNYWIARTYIEEKNFSTAQKRLRDIFSNNNAPQSVRDSAHFDFLRTCYLARDPENGLDSYERKEKPTLHETSTAMWTYLYIGDWKSAQTCAKTLAAADKSSFRNIEEYESIRYASDMINKRPDFALKSPAAAAVLSAILPGAGHLYAGNPLSAFGSFILNGSFIALTAYGIHQKNYILAGIAGFFEIGWYSGNIASAYQEARLVNLKAERQYKEPIMRSFPYGLGYTSNF
jgi:hypothetical protein